jgi:hypothetical protein
MNTYPAISGAIALPGVIRLVDSAQPRHALMATPSPLRQHLGACLCAGDFDITPNSSAAACQQRRQDNNRGCLPLCDQ